MYFKIQLIFLTFFILGFLILLPSPILAENITIFSDTMENGINGWTIGGNGPTASSSASLWHQSQKRSFSPVTSWYYGKEDTATYNTGDKNAGVILSPNITIPNLSKTTLRFNHLLDTENQATTSGTLNPPVYDKALVEITKDGGITWKTLANLGSTSRQWEALNFDISDYVNSTIQIKFSFDTVDAMFNDYWGWHIDDVFVFGETAPINTAPIANAETDQTGFVNNPLIFDGSASSDPENGPLTFRWNFGDGSEADGQRVNHTYTKSGTYTVTLTVTDSGGLTSTDSALITIKTDVVNITKAIYIQSKKQLVVEALSSEIPYPVLSVEGFGQMQYISSENLYRLVVSNLRSIPSAINVLSSYGGTDTETVSKQGK